MKLRDIIEIIEKEFPREKAYDWDNVGLLVGDENREIKKVFLTLDVTLKTVSEAIEKGAELILSHHPVMLSPINRITTETHEGKMLIKAIENKVNIYAAHTNCDVAERGINARLAEIFELAEVIPAEENGLGRIGNLKKEMNLEAFARLVSVKLSTPHIRVCGDTKSTVKRIAVGSGACSDIIPDAIKNGAEVLITGDTKYHTMLEAVEAGINVIDAGHYPTEIIVMDIFEDILKSCDIEVVRSENEDVFKFI